MSHDLDRTSTDTTVVSQSPLVNDEDTDHHRYDDIFPGRDREDGLDREDDVAAAPVDGEAVARDKFGGINWGASFFGWLVAVAVATLLMVAAGAVSVALGTAPDLSPVTGRAGLLTTAVLLVLLLLGYYTGGYVAGRMSRFDGGRQGFAVWLLGLLVTGALVGLGVFLKGRYDLGSRVDLSGVQLSTDQVSWQVLAGAGLIVLAATLLAAVLGGSVGRRYHSRVDRVVHA